MSIHPLISIVIPAYNSALYLEETLRSLAAQASNEFEVIVVDDKSTDNTFEIAVKELARLNLKGAVYARPDTEPKGVASCRNMGVIKAGGEWISFLDSDDIFYAEKISRIAGWITKYGADCKAIHHASRNFEDGTNKTLKTTSSTFEGKCDILEALLHKNIISTSSVTIQKGLLVQLGGFSTMLHGVEDYMLWLRVSKKTNWFFSNEVLTGYRVRAASLMSGREMSYYVKQNRNLLIETKKYNEFTEAELASIDKHLFEGLMYHYASESINKKGPRDFLKGVLSLTRIGKRELAATLLFRYFRHITLTTAQKALKKIRSVYGANLI